eukprot:TRINITY_DN31833_c0_g1_i1.p2 TRINITY_DN31833_c0_g1~~TRINITY_DN31833_c0_g1_i1.p2  ORF type:complete len:160 (-),score=45.36 TRINITY_DN31833_c0_g1_i1:115-594(-)
MASRRVAGSLRGLALALLAVTLLRTLTSRSSAFAGGLHGGWPRRSSVAMEAGKEITFDTVAREWRMKYEGEPLKGGAEEANGILDELLPKLKAIEGVKSVQRVVCGGCLDFKVITAVSADKFGAWEESGFAPEAEFLEKVKAVPGMSLVETQTYTLADM